MKRWRTDDAAERCLVAAALAVALVTGWANVVRAESPALLAAVGPSQLNWALRIGATCVRQPDLACDAAAGGFVVCR